MSAIGAILRWWQGRYSDDAQMQESRDGRMCTNSELQRIRAYESRKNQERLWIIYFVQRFLFLFFHKIINIYMINIGMIFILIFFIFLLIFIDVLNFDRWILDRIHCFKCSIHKRRYTMILNASKGFIRLIAKAVPLDINVTRLWQIWSLHRIYSERWTVY